MSETFFAEMKRYVRFGPDDERALARLAPFARPHFAAISDEFYERLHHHERARTIFSGPTQVTRLKGTLVAWMEQLLSGPWDEAYFERRARIGRAHVEIALPQRYMFGAMDVIRLALLKVASDAFPDEAERLAAVGALHKLLDLELSIMLETYRESFVADVQRLERAERIGLEERLAISEARYDEIVEKGDALITTATHDGRIVLFNRRCEEVTGIARADAIDRTWDDIFGGGALVLARSNGHPSRFEGRVRTPDGREHRIRWHLTTLPGRDDPLLCALGIDVTEEHDLGVRTRRAERLASLGTMAAGLAHEIRNPLNAAHLQLTLVQRRIARATEADRRSAAEAAELAGNEMKRLASLVEEFLEFARPQPLRLGRGDLRGTVDVIGALMAPEAAQAGIELSVEPGPPVVAEYDDERIKQVLLNLVRNSIEASGKGGHVRLRVGSANGFARLEVEDDGRGLPSPDAAIFEPFFTTKETGTGLGLPIAHRIVADHGGRFEVDSRAGRTVFAFLLPLPA